MRAAKLLAAAADRLPINATTVVLYFDLVAELDTTRGQPQAPERRLALSGSLFGWLDAVVDGVAHDVHQCRPQRRPALRLEPGVVGVDLHLK